MPGRQGNALSCSEVVNDSRSDSQTSANASAALLADAAGCSKANTESAFRAATHAAVCAAAPAEVTCCAANGVFAAQFHSSRAKYLKARASSIVIPRPSWKIRSSPANLINSTSVVEAIAHCQNQRSSSPRCASSRLA